MRRSTTKVCGFVLLCFAASSARAQDESIATTRVDEERTAASEQARGQGPDEVLAPAEWRRVDAAVNRALQWFASQQRPDGSFPTVDRGQPGVTSLCVLAFMAHGNKPNDGEFGARLESATDYILSCQQPNGLVALLGPQGLRITPNVSKEVGEACAYNHAISSLALSEMYGMGHPRRAQQLQKAIQRSLRATLEMQRWLKDVSGDRGGWRYITDDGAHDSDLSITGWQLMFMRSARNAGFNVPEQRIDDAIAYVRRTFDQNAGTFGYTLERTNVHSRGMAGAGILALAHAGFHQSAEAKRAADWLVQNNFDNYNGLHQMLVDRYHYSVFNACQGMYQIGSPYWERFFPRTVTTLLANQRPNGSWDPETRQRDGQFGNSYTTALVVLALGAPNQFLPVFQR